MKNSMSCWKPYLLFPVVFVLLLPVFSFAEELFGGLTFIGEREGICIEIAGKCAAEDILFELNTCNSNNEVKGKFKERMPFTILVPKGKHELVIKKDGKELIKDEITIDPEKVLEYRLP
ncbi:MAG: hypothetical protein ABFR63_09535 [Thermodesulfobacteriota bacterium]